MKNTILSRIRNRLVKAPSVLSLKNSKEFLKTLRSVAFRLISIATNRIVIGPRLQRFNKFLELLLKVYRHHGSVYVVKWLKSSHVAVQRKLSSKPMGSLRELEKDLPLPRLINGLPSFIGTMDRRSIRMKHPGTIRLWLTILSVYRVISCLSKLNLQSITDPWKGDPVALQFMCKELKDIIAFNKMHRNVHALGAKVIHPTVAAGPNFNVSLHSIITDAYTWTLFPELLSVWNEYAVVTNSHLRHIFKIYQELALVLFNKFGLSKFNISAPRSGYSSLQLGKLAFKQEAAGKIRVFAIADIWTQSLLKPLHEDLFSLLKTLPNDGTFDQDASFARCLSKAKDANMAFSFDLSSATDKLPIKFQISILNTIFKSEVLGELWAKLLVDREYIIRSKLFPEQRGDLLRYGTGQPMGCLSSWAMLAITHHFIMQIAAFRVYGTRKWFDKYEILGDDIIIFDNHIASVYLEIMKSLDVGINLSKSLISEQLQTLEFAKRTGVDGIDVSGLSWKQLITENTDTGRTSFALSMLNKGYIQTPSMLVRAIAESPHAQFKNIFKVSRLRSVIEKAVVNILGSFSEKGKITLGSVVALLVDPSFKGGYNRLTSTVPITKVIQVVLEISKGTYSAPVPPAKKKAKRDFVADMFAINPVRALPVERTVDRIQLGALYRANRLLEQFISTYEKKLAKALVFFLPDKIWDETKGKMVIYNHLADLSKTQVLILKSITEKLLIGDSEEPEALQQQVNDFIFGIESGVALPKDAIKLLRKVEKLVGSFDITGVSPSMGIESSLPSIIEEIKLSKKLVLPYSNNSEGPLRDMMRDLQESNFMDFKLGIGMKTGSIPYTRKEREYQALNRPK